MDFRDRRDAGRRLGRHLAARDDIDDPVVFGLARGGVPVAADVAAALAAPLDVLVVRKVGAPGNPEYALGAVAEDDVTVLDESTVERVGAAHEIDGIVAHERREVERRVERYRGGRPPTPVEGRTAVIVDDGIATGRSAIAAVRAVRNRKPARVLVAAPVGAPQSVAQVAEEADDVVCLDTPEAFFAVGAYYRDFGQTSDDEVAALLNEAHEPSHNDRGGDRGIP